MGASAQWFAVEWSGGSIIKLPMLPGSTGGTAAGINDAGQVVGYSFVGGGYSATEWNGGSVTNLSPPGSALSLARGINDAGTVVGGASTALRVPTSPTPPSGAAAASLILASASPTPSTASDKWWERTIAGLRPSGATAASSTSPVPGAVYSWANSINDVGQVVGVSCFGNEFPCYATEWSGGSVINLGGLPGNTSSWANGINDAGQIVGWSYLDSSYTLRDPTEWSGGSIVSLPGGISPSSLASGINDAGQVVGQSSLSGSVPKSSTWAMMLLGFAGLRYAGYCRGITGDAAHRRARQPRFLIPPRSIFRMNSSMLGVGTWLSREV